MENRGKQYAREETGTGTGGIRASAHRDIRNPRSGRLGDLLSYLEFSWSWFSEPLRVSIRPVGPRTWYFTRIVADEDADRPGEKPAERRDRLKRERHAKVLAHPYPLVRQLALHPSWAPDFTERPYLWRMLVALPGGLVVPWPSDEATAAVERLRWSFRVEITDRAFARSWEALAPVQMEDDGPHRGGWAELTADDREAIAADRET